ncbi:MAG: putative nucleic acid-binding Zn-ribbon protein [Enterobacterales bacterium]|jgi:predicted  nucleic acid-binding Zn-ribbon protein
MTIITMALLITLSLGLMIAGIQLRRFQKQLTEQRNLIKKIYSELNANSSGSIGLGHRLLTLEKQMKELKSRHQDMVSFGSDDQYQKRTYKQASQLALMGATIDELKNSCELSHGEAELLSHMNLSHSH